MNISIQAKRIIFQILILIMKADLITKQEELDYLDKVFKDFQLTIDEFDHMDDVDKDYLVKEFSLLDNEQKDYGKKLFLEMASCDGFVDPREMAIINELK